MPTKQNGSIEPHVTEDLEEVTDQPLTIETLLRSDEYWMQDKSDGHWRGIIRDGVPIYGFSKLGGRKDISDALMAELKQIPLTRYELDAELVGERLVCRDLLVAGKDITHLPYEERFTRLVTVLNQGFKLISVVETWAGAANKRAALQMAKDERREGVVFKLRSAQHKAGYSCQHKKFKFVKTCSVIAGVPRASGADSVEVFLRPTRRSRTLISVCNVSLIGKPEVKEGDILEVRYLYAFPTHKLSQARFDRVRSDVRACDCTLEQLIYKREQQ